MTVMGTKTSLRSIRVPSKAARALYARELAYYEADKAYLSVEKLARRCEMLSLLLMAANGHPRGLH